MGFIYLIWNSNSSFQSYSSRYSNQYRMYRKRNRDLEKRREQLLAISIRLHFHSSIQKKLVSTPLGLRLLHSFFIFNVDCDVTIFEIHFRVLIHLHVCRFAVTSTFSIFDGSPVDRSLFDSVCADLER